MIAPAPRPSRAASARVGVAAPVGFLLVTAAFVRAPPAVRLRAVEP